MLQTVVSLSAHTGSRRILRQNQCNETLHNNLSNECNSRKSSEREPVSCCKGTLQAITFHAAVSSGSGRCPVHQPEINPVT